MDCWIQILALHRTWIQDLGYYYAPNDYYDIITYLDFYDRSKVQIDSKINYKKSYGNNWYNYNYYGHFQINNFINELNPSNNNFNYSVKDLFDESCKASLTESCTKP